VLPSLFGRSKFNFWTGLSGSASIKKSFFWPSLSLTTKAAFKLSVPVFEENLVPSTIAEKLAPVEDAEDGDAEDDGWEDACELEHPANHKEEQTMLPIRIKVALIGFILMF
jgi:hypothetical protein